MLAVSSAPIPCVSGGDLGVRLTGTVANGSARIPRLSPTTKEKPQIAPVATSLPPHRRNLRSSNTGSACRRISKSAKRCRAFSANSNDQRLPVGRSVDKDLWQVLELASDDELLLLADILYSQSLLSPLLKNILMEPAEERRSGDPLSLQAMTEDARQVAERLRGQVEAAGSKVADAGGALRNQVGELAESAGSSLIRRLAGWRNPSSEPSASTTGRDKAETAAAPRGTAAGAPGGAQAEATRFPLDPDQAKQRPKESLAELAALLAKEAEVCSRPAPSKLRADPITSANTWLEEGGNEEDADKDPGYLGAQGVPGSGGASAYKSSSSSSSSSVPAWRRRAEEDLARGRREVLMARLDARLRFLAAGALETFSGKDPSYRDLLLSLRRKLGIGAATTQGGEGSGPLSSLTSSPPSPSPSSAAVSRLAVADLEAEIFQHLLRAELAAMGDPDVDAALLQGPSRVPDVQMAAELAEDRDAQGALPWDQALREGQWARTLANGGAAVVLGGAKKTLRGLALHKLEAVALKKVAVKAAAALASPAGILSIAGRVMWVLFAADLAVRAVGTDYSRVERAVFLLGKIRLRTSYGWTNGPPEE